MAMDADGSGQGLIGSLTISPPRWTAVLRRIGEQWKSLALPGALLGGALVIVLDVYAKADLWTALLLAACIAGLGVLVGVRLPWDHILGVDEYRRAKRTHLLKSAQSMLLAYWETAHRKVENGTPKEYGRAFLDLLEQQLQKALTPGSYERPMGRMRDVAELQRFRDDHVEVHATDTARWSYIAGELDRLRTNVASDHLRVEWDGDWQLP